MKITKLNYFLILILFLMNNAFADSQHNDGSWMGTLSNLFPWNWYTLSETEPNLEYVEPKLKKAEMPNDLKTTHDEEIYQKNDGEKSVIISFSDFMKEVDSEIASEGITNPQKISSIYESVQNAFTNNKLSADIVVGGRKLLVTLGLLNSDERTKNAEEVNNALINLWNMFLKLLRALFFWIPGMESEIEMSSDQENKKHHIKEEQIDSKTKKPVEHAVVSGASDTPSKAVHLPQSPTKNAAEKQTVAPTPTTPENYAQMNNKQKCQFLINMIQKLNTKYVGMGLLNQLNSENEKEVIENTNDALEELEYFAPAADELQSVKLLKLEISEIRQLFGGGKDDNFHVNTALGKIEKLEKILESTHNEEMSKTIKTAKEYLLKPGNQMSKPNNKK